MKLATRHSDCDSRRSSAINRWTERRKWAATKWLWCVIAIWLQTGIAAGAESSVDEPNPFDVRGQQPLSFDNDVQPLLTRYGCNSGPCHGKSRGQNGFALSLLGFDSEFDYQAIAREARGRRVFPSAPETSLLLRKATGQLPHGGGVRFDPDSKAYRLLSAWIAAGTPATPPDAPRLQTVQVEPTQLSLAAGDHAKLQVWADYSDGTRRNVTDAAAFQSNDQTVAAIDADGAIKAGTLPGETALMARYMNNIAVCAVTIPLPGEVPESHYAALPVHNEIDERVWDKLRLLGMLPSATASDAVFLRRAYVRAIGRLPTADEARGFLADTRDNKRSQLVDELLDRPEYADFWANKWADLLRPNPYRVGMKAVWMMDAWLRDAFRENQPYDEMVRELLTARGSTFRNGATVMFRDRPQTVEIGASVSQLFLGVRLECAKCHHHPFEVWSQDDFFGFAAFFARVGHRGGLSPPISGTEELIYTAASGKLEHGRTGAAVEPKALLGSPLTIDAEVDPREVLVNWMTADTNPFFAQVMANRIWAELMGQGIVDPVDDMRATNPASNQPLLDFLAAEFRAHDYDIKHLIRTIMKSHVFELSSVPSDRNLSDSRNFSRY
ncbi:MAG: DUF1549 domain-containing protein, partial [Planctomycetales bacterium]|nr:DUF1549 domain-containing protein [Planctomycetales bacterium]